MEKNTNYDMRLKCGTTITIAGPSQSGKSTLVEKIVKSRDRLFDAPISKVLWYSNYEPSDRIEGVIYVKGIPNESDVEARIISNCLLVLDDYMDELSKSSLLTAIMTKKVHHLPMTLIYLTQNIFQKANDAKTRRLNTNYLILFKNPQDRTQIDYLGRQMYPHDKNFLRDAFDDATKHAYSYLLIDSIQSTPDEVRVRTNIINDGVLTVYVPHSINNL